METEMQQGSVTAVTGYAAHTGAQKLAVRRAPFSQPLGKNRSPGSVLGLSIITLGIYFLVWYGKLNGEIRRHDPDIKVNPALSVLAMFCPIANIVSAYSTAARIRQMQLSDGSVNTISPVVAMLLFMFLGIGFPLYLASHVREHWHGHHKAARHAIEETQS